LDGGLQNGYICPRPHFNPGWGKGYGRHIFLSSPRGDPGGAWRQTAVKRLYGEIQALLVEIFFDFGSPHPFSYPGGVALPFALSQNQRRQILNSSK
jgi:hypothetical protein